MIVFFGEYLGYILIAGLLVFWWKNRKRFPRFLWEFLGAAVLSRLVVTELIRFFWDRPRPFVENNVAPLIEHAASPSFPSGHAAFFFAIATVVYFYNKKTGILLFLASALIGIARVLAGLHWTSDIIGGALIGIFSAWIVIRLFQSHGTRFFKRPSEA